MGSFLLVLGKKKPKARNWKVKVEEAVGGACPQPALFRDSAWLQYLVY